MSAPSIPGPSPAVIREFRQTAGLTMPAAAALVYVGVGTWAQWEYGKRTMPYAYFELFSMKLQAQR